MVKSTLVYPYDIESAPLIRHKKMFCQGRITNVCSLNSFGLTGRDACKADGGEKTNIIIDNDVDRKLMTCDQIMLVNSRYPLNKEKYILPVAEKALKYGKKVIFDIDTSDIAGKILKLKDSNPSAIIMPSNINCQNLSNQKINVIEKPVVMIAGGCEFTSKFETQMALTESFRNNGYKVSTISSRVNTGHLDIYPFPDFMYSKVFNEEEKIIMYNNYIKNIEREDNPDLIVIGIPYGISSINKNIHNKFGIMAMEIISAVHPDAFIYNIPFSDKIKSEDLQIIENEIKIRYNIELTAFVVSNLFIDWDLSNRHSIIEYIVFNSEKVHVEEYINKTNKPMYNILNSTHVEKLFLFIENELSNNNKYKLI